MTRRLARWGLLCLVVLFFVAAPASAAPVPAVVTADPSSLTFSNDINDAPTASQQTTITNGGGTDVHITSADINGTDASDFSVDSTTCSGTLVSGGSCTADISFSPGSVGSKSASFDVVTDGGNASVDLNGTATERDVTPSPSSIDFGGQTIGTSSTDEVATITNDGTGDVTFSDVAITGSSAFQIDDLTNDCTFGDVLHEGDSCTMHVKYSPTFTTPSITPETATLDFHTNAPAVSVDLSGYGTQPLLEADPTSLDLTQDIDDGPSATPAESTITNTGSEPVTIDSVAIEGTDQGDFAIDPSSTCVGGTTVLQVNDTCTVDVTLDPTTTGTKDATVRVTSSGTSTSAPDVTIGLTGHATQTALDLSPTSISFGTRALNAGPTDPPETATITNTGTEDVTLTGITADGDSGDFTHLTGGLTDCTSTTLLQAGDQCDLRYAFDPASVGAKSATVHITSDVLPELTLALDGTGNNPVLTPSPTSHNFGSQDIHAGPTSPPQDFTFTSTGDDRVDVSSVSIDGGGNDQFQRVSGANECTSSTQLTPTQACHVYVVFDPSFMGPKTASVSVHSNSADSTASLTGSGALTEISPQTNALHFGSQEIDAGPTAAQTNTITNTGTEPVTLTGVSIGGSQRSQFKRLTDQPATDCATGTTLTANQTCDVRIQFDPSWTGAKAGTVTVASNAPDVSFTVDGTGAQSTFTRSDAPLAGSFLFDGPVNAVAFDSAGRAYVGGSFTSIGQRTGRGVHLTTASDQPDPAFPDVDGPINAVASDGSGGWFIGGSFANVGGTPRANLAHILSSGAVDSAWNPGANDTVNAIAVSGGSVYVGGAFTQAGGQSSIRLAKLSASTGALDTSWAPAPNSVVSALAVSGAGVYAGGTFTTIGGQARSRVARIDSAGNADSFDPSANGVVDAIALDGTDVYLGGAFTQVSSQTRNKAAKVSSTGTLDATWDPNASGGDIAALTVSGTDVYTGGTFTSIGGQTRAHIARLTNSTGSADATWDPNASGAVNGIAASGSDVYAVGAFTTIGGQPRNRIARVSATSGSADSWNPNANGAATAIAINGSDIYVGGQFTSVGGQTARNRIARLLPDGTVDPDWDPGANNTVNALIVSGSGVYAAGQFTNIGGATHNRIARLTTADGAAVDATWNPDANNTVFALSLNGTALYAGGSFTQVGGATHTRLVKLSTTDAGGPDASWAASASASVLALASDSSFVYAGGSFINLGGQTRQFIGRVDAANTGAVDMTWNPSADSTVNALALSGSDLFVGGAFSSIGGQTRNRLVKLSTSGAGPADLSWDPNANGTVRALAIAGTDIYAGGDFMTVSGGAHGRIVRLATSDGGAADPGWDPNANGSVNALAATNTRLAAGGAFTTAFGQSRQSFAIFELPRLSRDPSTLQFGSQDIDDGATPTLTSTVTNSGATSMTLSSVTNGGPDSSQFTRLTGGGSDCAAATVLAPGGTCTVRVQFDPSSTGVKSADVTIAAPGTPDVTVGLVGTGTQTALSRSPTSLPFGSQDIDDGATAPMESTVTNSGTQTVTLAASNSVTITGGDAGDFTRLDDQPTDCFDGLPLSPGQTCKLRVQFDPATTGGKSATLTVNSDSGPLTVALSGTGTQTQLGLSSNTFAFGKQDIDDGATTAQDSTVTNTGTEPVTLATLAPSSADFQRLTGNVSDCTVSQTLASGDTCHVRVAFDPGTVGSKTASLPITSNAPTVTIGLSGEGTQTQLSPAPGSLSFGSKDIDDGATATQTSGVTNSGTEDVTITGVDVTTDFTRVTGNPDDCFSGTTLLHAGDTCKLRLAFNPGSVGAKAGSATVHSNAPDATVALDGTGIQTLLSLSPGTQAFGKQDIDDGATTSMSSTVTNTGTEPVAFNAIDTSGDGGDFLRQSGASECTATTTLNAGETCTLTYQFDPTTTGSKSATVTVDSNAADVSLTLTGEGTQTQLSRSPNPLAFGGQDVDSGATGTKTSVVTNSGTETVNLSGVSLGGTDPTQFVRLTNQPTTDCSSSTVLTAGQTCDVRVQFDPSTKGDKTATITVSSNAADIAIDLTGTGKETRLSRSPTSFAFGSKDIDDGPTAAQSSTITNVGSEDVTIGSVGITGTNAIDFVRQTGNASDCAVGTVLTAGATCTLRVAFDPSSVGAKTATGTVSANGVDMNVDLSGTGIQTELSRSPATLSFGSRDIDDAATAEQLSTVTNTGTEPVTLTSVTVSPADFVRQTGDAADCAGGTVLNAGDTCKVRLTFDPSTVGAKTGTATVHSNAADISVALDGTGTQTQLSPDTTTLAFGKQDIDDGATTAHVATITNTGTEPVSLSGVNQAGSSDFTRATGTGNCSSTTTLTAGQSCAVSVTFDPSSTGSKSGSVTLTSGQVPDIVISLSGQGTQTGLSRAPASLAFGKKGVNEGATSAKTSVVTNSGTEDVTLTGVDVTGDFAQASAVAGDCGNTSLLHAGDSCNLRTRFNPNDTGPRTGTATVHSNAADVSVALSGTGIATDLSPSPAQLAFGKRDIDDGATSGQSTTITNVSPDPVIVGTIDVTGPNADEFERLANIPGDCVEDQTLAPDATCTLHVRFDPSATGARTATLNVPAANGGATATVDLAGSGTQTGITRNVASISAGSQDVDNGPTTPQGATVTNFGTEDVTISGVDVTGEFSQAAVQAGDCAPGQLLHGGDTCSLRVQFDPSSIGGKSGTATVHSSAGDVSVALDGTGSQSSIAPAPTALDFGSHEVGSGPTAVQESTVTNTGTEPVTLTDVQLADPASARFQRASGLPTDCTPGATLNAGETCKLRATYVPQSAGTKSATMTLSSSAGIATVILTGTGTPRPALRVPSFSAKARSTRSRRLSVPVVPTGGTIRNIVVQVKSSRGKLLGTGKLASASTRRTVTVNLKSALKRGTYRAIATGRDVRSRQVFSQRRVFKLR